MQAHTVNLAAPDSALDALLIILAVVVGLIYCIMVIVRPGPSLFLSVCAALCFALGYFPALGLGASRSIASVSGGGVLLIALLVFFILAWRSAKRAAEEDRLKWEAIQEQAGNHGDMDRYWSDD